ncbi:glycosyltransferase family 2 protein [Lachnospiraceae bacterium 62-35]
MKREKQVRVSQCMIVKNEAHNIERALSWGRDMMWEQVVVDTGSTDNTVELAEKMGARIFSFSWTDDFAAAKNYAISKAEGDWIAFLDADEYMERDGVEKLKLILQGSQVERLDGISTGWQQLNEKGEIFSSGTQIRFFQNLPDIRYRRRIHEQLESLSGRPLRIGDAVNELSIFHTGYQGKAFEEKKRSNRNRRLIQEELREHPEDYEMMGYMGDEYFSEGSMKEAEEWYFRSIAHMPSQLEESDQRSAVTFSRLLTILTEGEGASWERGKEIYAKAVGYLPKEADFDYLIGRFFAAKGEAEKAVFYLEAAIHKLNTFGCSNKALLLAANLLEAYDLLVRCSYEARQWDKCTAYGAACLKYDKYRMGVLSCLLKALISDRKECDGREDEYEQVLGFFAKIYDNSLKDRLFLVKTSRLSGCGGFSEYLSNRLFSNQELELLKKI